jgi:hypothetical protein
MWIYNMGDLAVNVWNTHLLYQVVLWSVKAAVCDRKELKCSSLSCCMDRHFAFESCNFELCQQFTFRLRYFLENSYVTHVLIKKTDVIL